MKNYFLVSLIVFLALQVAGPVRAQESELPLDPQTGQPMTLPQLRQLLEEEDVRNPLGNGIPRVSRYPYIPQIEEYSLELGSSWTRQNLYWMGVGHGNHIGHCLFSNSETCQQFFDQLIGVAGRDGSTNYLGTVSLRWQFVNFPKVWSPLFRVFVGDMHSIEPELVRDRFTYGVGYGFTTYLNKYSDFRVELRTGFTQNEGFGQVLFGAIIKLDQMVTYFAVKLKDIGLGTVQMTGQAVGTVIETGVDATGTVLKKTGETVAKPFRDSKKEDATDKVAPKK